MTESDFVRAGLARDQLSDWVVGKYSLTVSLGSVSTGFSCSSCDDQPIPDTMLSASSTQIVVLDDAPRGFCGTGSGTYDWNVSGGLLTLRLVHDPCASRAAIFAGTFTAAS